jgi:signal transduction histidine kinase/CHASE3 domain sensor protein
MPRFLRWSSLGLRTKGLIVVGLPVVPLAVFWGIVIIGLLQAGQPANTTGRSLIVQANVARVLSDLLDADAGARHSLLTSSISARRRYDAAIDRLGADMAALDNAVIDPSLRQSLGPLRHLVDNELAVLARLAGSPASEAAAISEVEALTRSTEILEQIRTLATTIEKRQVALATTRSEQNRGTARLYFILFFAGSVVCVCSGVVAALVLANGVSRRARALSRNAERLAHGLPIELLPAGEDEIGRVDARLREAAQLLQRRERELRDRTTELETANHELEAFSYSVSHDLRAPLRAIDGFSEALETDCAAVLNASGLDSLRRVRGAARRMSTLIDELLDLSRLTRVEPKRERVDVGGTAASILAEFAKRSPSRGVDVQVAPGLVADADPELVQIALHNLLDNAWKYTGKTSRPRIEIGSTPNGVARVFHVRDNGAGFDMTRVDKMFGAFQRLHPDRDFEGTGIGLAIVHRIVSRHGGRIWAEGSVNAGATFYFTLEPETAPGS